MTPPENTFPFFEELDDEQRAAVVAEENAVVSAGAGSGKTRVLSARYGWLIMTGRCEIEQILTITFTNKAANEMYRRIYSLLSAYAPSNKYARKAVENFYKARISTLDSFCSGVARTVSRRFGISPGFKSDEIRVKETARSLALRFVQDKRNDPALQSLIAEKKIRLTAEELFVLPMLNHSAVSAPFDFNHFEKIQRKEILECWKDFVRCADEQVSLIEEKYSGLSEKYKLHEQLSAILPQKQKAPDIEELFALKEKNDIYRDKLALYLNFLYDLKQCSLNVGKKNSSALEIKDAILELRDLYTQLEALANNALQWDIVQAVFSLLAEYQEILNQKKRETGILTFNDIAQLAVDGLRQHEDIRRMYRDSFRMIMIDEFQDNNSLQRELVDLLAGPARVFYVGDEKQSIYRFRGADVSVFRRLAEQTECRLSLNRNYRSHPALIRAFNLIFGGYRRENDPQQLEGVFPSAGTKTEDYQASYSWIKSGEDTDLTPRLHFAFFDKGRLDPEDSLRAEDYEAAYIASTIQNMASGEQSYGYGDFAVLLRSHTHQHSLERAFKLYGIPFSAGRPAALFNDAPVNDLWAFLKLLVYPGDRIAYAALLRSPFVRLSEDAFTLCMLQGRNIFDESLDEKLPTQDCRRYREARRRYRELLLDARDLPFSSLITRLWYEEGYRHEVLWSAPTQVYLDLYDLFFEQARIIEKRGGGLVDFLDYLEDLAARQEKPDDSALPDEEGSGVQIMTIHHAKGLEFPVVFVYGCGGEEKTSLDRRLALFSERRGMFIQIPQSEELPEAEDYFFLAEKQEYRNKTEAELRRLLYVAMTRAEQELFITAVIPAQNKEERENLAPDIYGGYGKEFIVERLEQYRTKPDVQSLRFLHLLPGLSTDHQLYTIEAIDTEAIDTHTFTALRKNTTRCSLKETALLFRSDYETIPAVFRHRFVPQTVSASSLHTGTSGPPVPAAGISRLSETPDELFELTGIGAQDFGIIVHSFIEAIFNDQKPKLPSFCAVIGDEKQKKLASAAQALAEGFFYSPLGRKALSASFRKTEYPVLTAVERTQPRNHPPRLTAYPGGQAELPLRIIVSGKIDLLFDDGKAIYVVDFKTDRDEDITRHTGQLAMYKRAVEDIFGKPVECRLFYLRNSREVNPEEEINKTSPEELIAIWENSAP